MKKRRKIRPKGQIAEVKAGTMAQDAIWGGMMGLLLGGAFLALLALGMTAVHAAMENGRLWDLGAKSAAALMAGYWATRHGGKLALLRGGLMGGVTLMTALGMVGALGGALPTGITLTFEVATGAALGMAGTMTGRAVHGAS